MSSWSLAPLLGLAVLGVGMVLCAIRIVRGPTPFLEEQLVESFLAEEPEHRRKAGHGEGANPDEDAGERLAPGPVLVPEHREIARPCHLLHPPDEREERRLVEGVIGDVDDHTARARARIHAAQRREHAEVGQEARRRAR